MKIIFCILFVLPGICFSQTSSENDTRIGAGRKEFIHSTILKEDRELWIYVPASFTKSSPNKYPVLYLLDGPSFFYSMTGMVQYLSSIGQIPEIIVVGIANTNRIRDLTPTHSIRWSDGEQDTAVLGCSGGGEKFIAFIEHELIPYVDNVYATTPYRMLVGHSLGGLTVLNSMINHPSLFTSYVAIDPSVWWDNHALMKYASRQLLGNDYSNKSLFYASANTMSKGIDTSRVSKDTAYGNIHVRNNVQFHRILQKIPPAGLQWSWKFYGEDNHASVPLIAGYDALRFLFKGYKLDKDLNDTSITVDYIIAHYQHLSTLMHYTVLPSESIVNSLGYNFLHKKNFEKAFQFFYLNLENYPTSANAFDSMGDYYLQRNERIKAIENFRKALQLKELPETRKKLKELESVNRKG
ncbi:hypothetical protein KJS94_11395 [Flavihumibacter rivuli]|uniref:alpha/beta hydrolase-fold protein n=1 Tax=Flavihumibacter rivuli TaxID=2838156 RepID=UPI001BDEEEE5|nr:alpha/beta hydrolase-fold protein [Flavihumibacter rivuli]ULQ55247.1 hypothetical protein KJS94_11395 [Flavihumibacter rivuli]